MKKKICVVTTTRADYGIMRNTIKRILEDDELELCLLVSGTHLISEYGMTINEIVADNIPIADRISILCANDDIEGIAQTMGNAFIEFGKAFSKYKPDILLVMGDRYELLTICGTALVANIPIAHVSGGEVTEGAIDDCVRHCVTKMSTLHFPACEEYRRRIIQLGEQPEYVFNFGDPGVENILKMDYVPIKELEKDLGVSLQNCICMTFHPVTTQLGNEKEQLQQVLQAIEEFPEINFVITKANADSGGQYINNTLDAFAEQHDNVSVFASLGIRRYLSLIKNAKAVIGNSSSGIVEAPVLHTPTVNIGDRQKGRLMADSIISCPAEKDAIVSAIKKALSAEWQARSKEVKSLYGEGQTSISIVQTIKDYLSKHDRYEAKKFYDIK